MKDGSGSANNRALVLSVVSLLATAAGNVAGTQALLPSEWRPFISVIVLLATFLCIGIGLMGLKQVNWTSRTLRTIATSPLADVPKNLWTTALKGREGWWFTSLAAVLALTVAFHRTTLSPFLPGLYERTAAERTLDRYIRTINQVLTRRSSSDILGAFRTLHEDVLAPATSVKWLKRNALRVGAWPSEGTSDTEKRFAVLEDDKAVLKAAYDFIEGFGSIGRLRVVGKPTPQQHLSVNAGVQRWFVIAQYDGEFLIDSFCEDLKAAQLAQLLREPDSQLANQFLAMINEFYPNAAKDTALAALGSLPLHQFIYRDLPIQMARDQPAMGELDPSRLQNGTETVFYSIELENVNGPAAVPLWRRIFTNGWRIEEIGIWGMRRQRGDRGSARLRTWSE